MKSEIPCQSNFGFSRSKKLEDIRRLQYWKEIDNMFITIFMKIFPKSGHYSEMI